MNCRSRPQRLEEGSSEGKTALFITDGSSKGTPNRLKTANREEKALSSTKRRCFEYESAVFGKFLHEKALF